MYDDELEKYRIAVVQLVASDDRADNLARAGELLARAADLGAALAVLPECFAFFGRNDADQLRACERDGDGPAQNFLREAAARHKLWLVGGTVPTRGGWHREHGIDVADKEIYSACALINADGRRVAVYRKAHLFDVHVAETGQSYRESDVFRAGDEVVVAYTPFGALGLAVCYDLRFPEMFRQMIEEDRVDLIALPAAFTAATGAAHWSVLNRARAIENLAYVAAAGQGGAHPGGRETYGHSMIIDPWGRALAELGRGDGVATADIDRTMQARLRDDFPCLEHRRFA